jgi:hypothetical protein
MDQKCFNLVRGTVMRLTRLDRCGRIDESACSSVTTDGFIEVAMTSRITEGEAITVTKANGKTCVNDTPPSTWDGWSVNITFCGVDPLAFTMVTGQDVVYDKDGLPIGFSLRDDVDLAGSGVALELWSDVPSDACDPNDVNAAGSWGYSILPFLQGGVLADRTIANASIDFTVQNMQSRAGSGWGVGPYNVMLGVGDVAGPLLTPIGSREHERLFYTSVAPPEAGCSCMAYGTAATGVDEGAPGTWTPTDTYAPFSYDDLVTADPTASPATVWSTGSYAVLGDGTKVYWDGSAWQEGEAP